MDKTKYDKIISTDNKTLEENIEAVISAIRKHEKQQKKSSKQ